MVTHHGRGGGKMKWVVLFVLGTLAVVLLIAYLSTYGHA